MRVLLAARGCIALCAVLGPAIASAEPAAEGTVILPNAADPKPVTSSPQAPTQTVVVSIEKLSDSSSNAQLRSQKGAAQQNGPVVPAAPFHGPKPN